MDFKLATREGEIRTGTRQETTKGQYYQWIVDLGATNGFWQVQEDELERQEVVVREWESSNLNCGQVAGFGKDKPGDVTLGMSG